MTMKTAHRKRIGLVIACLLITAGGRLPAPSENSLGLR